MTDNREAGQHWLENAIDWYDQIPDTDPTARASVSAQIAAACFAAASTEAWDVVELDQSEMFERRKSAGGWLDRPELDEDNPDSLVEDPAEHADFDEDTADTVVRPYRFPASWGYPMDAS